jgi:hypothetical protein
MDVRAHFLSRQSCAECANDRDMGDRVPLPLHPRPASEYGIELCGRCLVVIDAVQAETKDIHGNANESQMMRPDIECCIVLFEVQDATEPKIKSAIETT